MSQPLRDRVFIITGASSGIGAAAAQEAGRAGMKVVLAARRKDKLEVVAESVREFGGQALVVPTDVADAEQVRRMVQSAVERFGRIDAIFANAGYGLFLETVNGDHEAAERRMWEVNYFGTVHCVREAGRVMIEQGRGGHILICSSIVGRSGISYYSGYAATKAAQHALGTSLRQELKPHSIHVSCVYPIGTDTEFSQTVRRLTDTHQEGIMRNTPRAFVQSPQHVARCVIRCLRRPRPEVWPSRSTHLLSAAWALFPRFRDACFSGLAARMQRQIETAKNGDQTPL